MTTGFLHPGAMGASIAALCHGEKLWVGQGRSVATHGRAKVAGLSDVGSLTSLVAEVDIIISVCPPGSALEVADDVAAAGFTGLYVDVNAISPATARLIGQRFERFVDGGIIGPPAGRPGTTRLYLCGDEASRVADLWVGTALETRIVLGGIGSASAVKACFASWTKGTAALMLAIRALAVAEGIEANILDEWRTSMPELVELGERQARSTAPKAWRFEGEMHQLADSFEAAGLPDGFLRAAAEVYGRLAQFKDSTDVDPNAVLATLLTASDLDSVTPAAAPAGTKKPSDPRPE
jgi:3-hydroxyisobutyrate dehydrogenase-like beta-hydroxyacid dehydrogenase